jgi:hypothetical protein
LLENSSCYPVAVSNRETKARERRLEALAQGETNVVERLLELRGDLDVITHAIDKLTMGPPRMRAGGRSGSTLSNLVSFRRDRP